MNNFKQSIIDLYGEAGKAWLHTLPALTNELAQLLGLRDLVVFEGLTYNYVLHGLRGDEPVVLKLAYEMDS